MKFIRNDHTRTVMKRHLPAVAFCICVVIISYTAWIHAGMPGTDDLSNLNVPQRQLLAFFYRHGEWPLWNPYSFAGQPFLAAGQSGPLYLPNLLFVCLPIVFALKASYLFHETLLAVGAYLCAWQFSKSRLGAIVGAVTFADCGFLIGHQIHTQMFDAACWFPLVIFLFVRAQQKMSRKRLALAALALSGEIYAGHPQMTFYLCLFIVLYLLLSTLWRPSPAAWRRFFGCLVPLAGGFLIAAAGWLPTLQFVSYSDRSGASPNFLLAGSMPPLGLAQFLMPYLAGGGYTGQTFSFASYDRVFAWKGFWELTCYAGLTTLILAVGVVLRFGLRHPVIRTLALIGGFCLLLCAGLNTFASVILTHVPGFDLFRIPARYVVLIDLVIAMLAARGVAALQSNAISRSLRMMVMSTAFAALLGMLAIHLFSRAAEAPLAAYLVPVILCLAMILFCGLGNGQRGQYLPAILACLMIADVSSHAVASTGFVDWQQGTYAKPSTTASFLRQHLKGRTWPRIASFGDTSLQLDRNLSDRIASVNGYDSVVPTWYVDMVGLTRIDTTFLSQPRSLADALGVRYVVTNDANTLPFPVQTVGIQTWRTEVPDLNAKTKSIRVNLNLGASAVQQPGPLFTVTLLSGQHTYTSLVNGWPASAYLVPIPKNWPHYQPTTIMIQNQAWRGSYQIESLQIDQGGSERTYPIHQTFAPKAWHRVAGSNGESVYENPDRLDRAWLTANANAPLVHSQGTVTCTVNASTKQTWHVQTKHSDWLVLSQMYDPNWHATVDGHPAQTKRVDGVLTAVFIKKGQHTVQLTYLPMSFRVGLAVSILSGLSTFALLL